jgi:hypothetical protein
MQQSFARAQRTRNTARVHTTDAAVARVISGSEYGPDKIADYDDASELGRTRAAALAFWMRENQTSAYLPTKFLMVLETMKRSPVQRDAFLAHIAHLVAVGSQHIDLNANLASQNKIDPTAWIPAQW